MTKHIDQVELYNVGYRTSHICAKYWYCTGTVSLETVGLGPEHGSMTVNLKELLTLCDTLKRELKKELDNG